MASVDDTQDGCFVSISLAYLEGVVHLVQRTMNLLFLNLLQLLVAFCSLLEHRCLLAFGVALKHA